MRVYMLCSVVILSSILFLAGCARSNAWNDQNMSAAVNNCVAQNIADPMNTPQDAEMYCQCYISLIRDSGFTYADYQRRGQDIYNQLVQSGGIDSCIPQ